MEKANRGDRLVEVGGQKMPARHGLFHQRNQVKDGPQQDGA